MAGLTDGSRTGSIAPMPAPFLSYLRVYEPLRAFEGSTGARVRAALARGPLAPERAGSHEREVCLRTQLRARLLPDGVSSGESCEVLVLGGATGEPLVCPLDTRARAAAAVLAFLTEEPPVVRASALPVSEAAA